MSTDLSTAQTGQVDEFALVLVSRAIDIIKLIQLVKLLRMLPELCCSHVSSILLLNTSRKLLFLLLHHFGLRFYTKVVDVFICSGCCVSLVI